MAAENTELNTSLFMEEVQKYPAIYNKFFKDYKYKLIRMSVLLKFIKFNSDKENKLLNVDA